MSGIRPRPAACGGGVDGRGGIRAVTEGERCRIKELRDCCRRETTPVRDEDSTERDGEATPRHSPHSVFSIPITHCLSFLVVLSACVLSFSCWYGLSYIKKELNSEHATGVECRRPSTAKQGNLHASEKCALMLIIYTYSWCFSPFPHSYGEIVGTS